MGQGALCRLKLQTEKEKQESTKKIWENILNIQIQAAFVKPLRSGFKNYRLVTIEKENNGCCYNSSFAYPNFFKLSPAPFCQDEEYNSVFAWWALKIDFLVCIYSSHQYPVAKRPLQCNGSPLRFWCSVLLIWTRPEASRLHVISNCFTAIPHAGMCTVHFSCLKIKKRERQDLYFVAQSPNLCLWCKSRVELLNISKHAIQGHPGKLIIWIALQWKHPNWSPLYNKSKKFSKIVWQ